MSLNYKKNLIFIMLSLTFPMSCIAASNTIVSSIGYGESPSAARHDASRNALERIIPQLVDAERVIANDEILIDQIRSSMTGFIESIDNEVLVKDAEFGYSFKADFQISESRISSFISLSNKNKTLVKGQSLFANIEKEKQQEEFFRHMFDKALSNYPLNALSVQVTDVRYDTTGAEPQIIVDVAAAYTPEFKSSMKNVLRTLSNIESRPRKFGGKDTVEICVGPECFYLPNYRYVDFVATAKRSFYPDGCSSQRYGSLVALAFTDDKGNFSHSASSGNSNDFMLVRLSTQGTKPKYGTSDQVAADGRQFPLLGFESAYSGFAVNYLTATTTFGIHFFDIPLKFSVTVPASNLDLEDTKFAKAFILTGYFTELNRNMVSQYDKTGSCSWTGDQWLNTSSKLKNYL